MPNKPAKNMRMAGAQVKALQNRLKKDSQLRGRFRQFVEDLKEVTKTGQFRKASWIDHRFAHEYNWTFSSVLQQSIEEELLDIAKATGSKKLRVWDDGAGEGDFLAWIKPEMAKYGIECETTALNHDANWRLMERYKEGEIDRVVVGLAETALPKRKQHAIFSLNGSLMYSPPELKRTVLKQRFSASRN
ncbi:MAG: hypothetical protein NT067_02520 [Candidatus Diapherotrites archaeon]|nr:hypothetical protein [Candidatus Diapherotrites archaeon]